MLDHQGLEELELKQKLLFLIIFGSFLAFFFFGSCSFKNDGHQPPKSRFLGHILTTRYPWVPWGGGVVFSNDLEQLKVKYVSVECENENLLLIK